MRNFTCQETGRRFKVLVILCLIPKIFAVFLAKFCDTVVVEFIVVLIEPDAVLDDRHSMGSFLGHNDELRMLLFGEKHSTAMLDDKDKSSSKDAAMAAKTEHDRVLKSITI